MRTILLRVVVFFFFAVCALGAQAQSVDCNNPTSVAPDGRTLSGNIPAMTSFWFSVGARGASSYAAEANYPTAADSAFPVVDAFAPGDVQPGCSGTSSLSPRNIRLFDPTLPNGNRVSVTAASAMTILVGVTNSTMQARDFTVRVSETTLFNPLWSTFGGFETFYRLQNTTRDSLNVTLLLINDAGTTLVTHNQMLAANSTAPTLFTGPGPLPGLGVADNQAGQAILTHDGPPGALQVDGFLGSFAGTPVVLPIKIVPAREGVSVSRLQPTGGGGGGGGAVNSVTAGDASITIGGTASDPTVAVTDGGITPAKLSFTPGTVTSLTEGTGIDLTPDTIMDTGSIAVNVGGTGSANTVARSDHTHEVAPLGFGNTGVGVNALAANAGASNTAVGGGALSFNSTGFGNTAVGRDALLSNNASNNTAVGTFALDSNGVGSSNSAVGFNALQSNTSGDNNTALGTNALALSIGANGNTAVGSGALFSNTVNNGTAVGFNALTANTTGFGNTAVGAGALDANTSGAQNVAVGVNALTANQSGNDNTAIGHSALENNTFGGNTAVGSFALADNTTGPNNTAVGNVALAFNVTGGNNTAVGASALVVNTGSSNTAVGASASQANSTGAENTSVGTGALFTNTTGSFNTAIGNNALGASATADNNTAVGRSALNANIAAENTAVGSLALANNLNGGNNAALGFFALRLNTGGSSNTALGTNALSGNLTGSGNIAIGSGAGGGLVSGSQNIYIGSGAASSGESNSIHIGNAHTTTLIAGIRGVAVAGGNAVVVDAFGQLGDATVSSRRVKEDIHDMGEVSAPLLQLRPVVFRYRQPAADGSKPIEFGLIAEEVAELMPELVVYDAEGQPSGVRYHVLPALLLNELQRQQAKVDRQAEELAALRELLAAQAAELAELKAVLGTTLAASRSSGTGR